MPNLALFGDQQIVRIDDNSVIKKIAVIFIFLVFSCKTQTGISNEEKQAIAIAVAEGMQKYIGKQYPINPKEGKVVERGFNAGQFVLIDIPEINYSIRIPNNMHFITRTKYTRGIEKTRFRIEDKNIESWMTNKGVYLLGFAEPMEQESIIEYIVISSIKDQNSIDDNANIVKGLYGNDYVFENTFNTSNGEYEKYKREEFYGSYYLYSIIKNDIKIRIEINIRESREKYRGQIENELFVQT